MNQTCSSRQKLDTFCRVYLQTMDPQTAANAAGYANGYKKLEEPKIREKLDAMRIAAADQIRREDAVRRLTELAFGRANDAVTMAAAWSAGQRADLGRLELSAISELKMTEKGVEVKFIDRVKALDALCKLLGDGSHQEVQDFFQALEEAGDAL